MSDNHLTDRQRESSKYIIATNQGESIIYTNEMKDDEQFHEEDQMNPVSELQTNEVEYEDEYQTTNNRNRSNSFDNKKKNKSKQNVQYYQQQQNKPNRNVKKHQHQGYYYQQTDPNEDFEYYAEENEEYEDNDEESFQVQQPLNNRLQQKIAMNKASKSDGHQSKPVLMNSSSNLNVVNSGRHQKQQIFSSPLKNVTNSPKPNNLSMNHHAFGYEVDPKDDKIDLWGHLLIGLSYFFLVFSFPFSLCACVKVAQEYERYFENFFVLI